MNANVSPPGARSESDSRALRRGQTVLWAALLATLAVLTINVVLLARFVERQANFTREHFFWILCQPGHSAVERSGAFHRLVAEGNHEWRSAQLSDLNLERISLPGADLQQAAFQRANLAHANLTAAKMNKDSL